MKFGCLILVSLFSLSTYADYRSDLRNTLENAEPVKIEQEKKFSKIGIKSLEQTKVDQDMSESSSIRACLAAVFMLQKAYHAEKDHYSNNLNELPWGSQDCQNEYSFSIKADAQNFEVSATGKEGTWQVDQDKNFIKL